MMANRLKHHVATMHGVILQDIPHLLLSLQGFILYFLVYVIYYIFYLQLSFRVLLL